MPEADGQAALPWNVRSELEGTHVTRKAVPVPIAELPGDPSHPSERGAGNNLADEANRQIGSGWRGSSLKQLSGGAGNAYTQSNYSQ